MLFEVILLIYEYTIAVEWNKVQNKEHIKIRNDVTGPFADRLDGNFFGFDQDYLERMPLLINSLQENSYFDPILEMSRPLRRTRKFNITTTRPTTVRSRSYKYNTIRRTSPRPFFFEYRSPTPMPFSKIYGSKSWVESYRNEERLKNIRQLITYLEKTINAKVADIQTKPSNNQIAFTGVYIEPMLENKDKGADLKSSLNLQQQSSNQINKFEAKHEADPLFSFKPENPGDVNLLADDFLRFAPIPAPSSIESSEFTLKQQIPFYTKNCLGIQCKENYKDSLQQSGETVKTDIPPLSTTKSFSVMLNLFPIRPSISIENKKKNVTTTTRPLDKIYLTTSRPKIHFKRKSVPYRRIYPVYKRPRYLSTHKTVGNKLENNKDKINNDKVVTSTEINQGTHMIVHVKVYSSDENMDMENQTDGIVPITQVNPYTSKAPIELSTSQIEDHHSGSSGYLPVEIKPNTPALPTLLPNFDTTTEISFRPTLPEVIKFSHEDAKVPDQYLAFQNKNDYLHKDISSRYSGNVDVNNEPSTLVVKLQNEIVTTTNTPNTVPVTTANDIDKVTTWTYVPQINGHYRSINQRNNVIVNPVIDRKKRLEMSVSDIRTYVPMYTIIKRNITKIGYDTDV